MSRRTIYVLAALLACSIALFGLALGGVPTQAQSKGGAGKPSGPLPKALKDMPEYMKANHGMFDNALTALYERWLAGENVEGSTDSPAERLTSPLRPAYGPDVRMSNSSFAGSQNEFQVSINPMNTQFAIGTSNDGRTAGVGIYATSDGGLTWTAQDAPIGTAACCDPAVDYGQDGVVYVGVLDTSPAGQHTLRSTDNGQSWQMRTFAALPDRNNVAVDPRDSNVVYITYSDLPTTNRIKGYKSTDGGATWGTSFFIGGPAPATGYQQSSQPRVANDGTVYVGYQQYLNSSAGCSAGVENVVSKSTDGGVTWAQTVLSIVQGGACTPAQVGRGIFCINASNSSFRSRSHPILGIHPTNSNIVYMVYSGGDLETPYTCGTATGFHGDTLFRKSTDGGATWSAPIRVNQDPVGKDQYYPWIDVAPSGRIWVGWHDRREDANNFQHKWYQAFSNDEGATWTESAVADVASQPSTFIGDYAGIAAENNRVLGMWWDSRSSTSGDPYTDPDAPLGPTSTPTPTNTPCSPVPCTNTPTLTRTNTPTLTRTPTLTPTPCGQYNFATATGTIVPGSTSIGQSCDDCFTNIALPFPFVLYGQSYSSVNVISNGNLQFVTSDTDYINLCLPQQATHGPSLHPHWDDLRTDQVGTGCSAFPGGCGVFTSISGSAPNRIFNIEWRAAYFSPNTQSANFEVRLYENRTTRDFEYIYGTLQGGGTSATTGVQDGTTRFTQYQCNTGIANGLQLNWSSPCSTPTAQPSFSATRTSTAIATSTPTATSTYTQVPATNTPTSTATVCVMNFSDVAESDWFYEFVRCLFCDGAISGYSDGTFRPYNNATRGQMTKIVVIAFDYPIYTPPQPTFTDVPENNPFYQHVETAAHEGIVSGYSDGTFRPFNNVTRGQLSKIVVVAAQWSLENPATPTFSDVPIEDPFYTYIETAYCHEIITGYSDGTFHPGNNATRAQISKMVCLAVRNEGQCGPVQVDIENYLYLPQFVTISAGDTVRWTNLDKVGHTATSVTPGLFDSGNLNRGESWQFTFDAPGTYEYLCTPHPWMTGTITVK